MIRALHRWPGLLAALLLTVLTVSGALLSLYPATDTLRAAPVGKGQTVADLAGRVQSAYPGVEQIRRAPSGRITVYWYDKGEPGSAVIDPASGRQIASAAPSPSKRWIKNLHRSLFLGDAGRMVSALGAATLTVLAISGMFLVARRAGGWRWWFSPIHGPVFGRLHVEVARLTVAGLLISSVTALWMAASTFDLLPVTETATVFPENVSGHTGVALTEIPALQQTVVTNFRELTLPFAGDASDVLTLKTQAGTGAIDQGTGALLSWVELPMMARISETIYMVHTGQGAASLGLILGLMALGVPLMAGTGFAVWITGRGGRPGIKGNAPAGKAQTVLLVGSEGGSTWGFAATLQKQLKAEGQQVHVAPMSAFAPGRYENARRIVVLAATYGDGDAPASARGFLEAVSKLDKAPQAPLAVLGFGDRTFPEFCNFAHQIREMADSRNWRMLIPVACVDRQSPQDFARWGRDLGRAMGLDLHLNHQPRISATTVLKLVSRTDYGADVQAPTAVLRFETPASSIWSRLTRRGLKRFEAGDLLGIVPEGSTRPRFYSLASAQENGFVEVVVRKHPGGLCSGQLMQLETGDTMRGFIRRNADFHPGPGRAPLILIGAGTGIGPLAGFVRNNNRQLPIHLFFGARHPQSDFLYAQDLADWMRDGRLDSLSTAFSREKSSAYVQDALRGRAEDVARLVGQGAKIMVCGGRDMACGVNETLAEILAPAGVTPAMLKGEGRYVEDVY